MEEDNEIFKSLILGGFIGATLGALLSGNKNGGSTVGALAGAVLIATLNANERARNTNMPVMVEENGSVFEIGPNGNRKFLKSIPKNQKPIPKHFKLK